jgi:hypothetical protein
MTDTLHNSTLLIVIDGHTNIHIELPGKLVDPKEYRLLELWSAMAEGLISGMPTGMEDLFEDDPDFEEYKQLAGWDE